MGTQQLLLILLGVIVVGAAVAMGIFIFGSNADQASKDAITQDCLHLSSVAQGYFRRPTMMGGGNNSFDGLTISDCGMIENKDGKGENLNATFEIRKAEKQELVIRAHSQNNDHQTVTLKLDMSDDNKADQLQIEYKGW